MQELYEKLDDDDRQAFHKAATRRRFRAGDKAFWQGDLGDSLHLVVHGSFAADVSTASAQNVIVGVFKPGDLFGELAALNPGARRSATMVALESSETMVLTSDQFRALCSRSPNIQWLVIEALARRLLEMTQQVLEWLYLPVDARLNRRLLVLHDAIGVRSPEGWMRIRQEELAGICGTSRASVNRALGDLARSGAIELGRGRVRVIDPRQLLSESALQHGERKFL